MTDHHSSPQTRPDLDENVNVAVTHANLQGTTASTLRERRVHENGAEPVPIWISLVAGITLLVGGVVLGQGGNLFSYDTKAVWADEYKPFDGGDEVAVTSAPALQVYLQEGSKQYTKCAACHGPDGKGDGASFPPLAGSEWVTGDNTEALASIILNGLSGPIEVNGRTWNSVMPTQAAGLGAKELAALMTYVRSKINDVGDVVTIEMAQAALDQYNARGAGKPTTSDELKAEHMKNLSGQPLAPETPVDFETLLPAEAGNEG